MPRIGEWARRVWFLLTRRKRERELREEIEAHRAAMGEPLRFGNSLRIREEAMDSWGGRWIDAIFRDIRFSVRMMARMPLLTAVIVVSLGIGIGANTAIFSGFEELILDPIPGVDGSSRYLLIEPVTASGDYAGGASFPEYVDMREALASFRDLAAFRMVQVNVAGPGRTERIFAVLVSENYFSTLELSPSAGRLDFPADASGDAGVVISHSYGEREFGEATAAVGRIIEVNGRSVPIAGVTPKDFRGTVSGLAFDLWIPSALSGAIFPDSDETRNRSARGYSVVGRLDEGIPRGRAQEDLDRLMARLSSDFPSSNDGHTARILSFWRAPRGGGQFVLPGMALLQAVMIALLLAVCGNTANLLLGRAMSREREMGIRMANGAGRWHILRLLMVESLLFGIVGAAIGALLASGAAHALSNVRFSTLLPVRFDPAVDGLGLLFSAGLGVASALVFGMVPALHLAREGTLGIRTRSRREPHRARRALITAEAALAVSVLMAAGLFLDSFRQTLDTDPGFEPAGMLLASYDVSGSDFGQTLAPESGRNLLGSFTARLLEGLKSLPEVEAVGIAAFVPLDIHGLPMTRVRVEGYAPADPDGDLALTNVVTPGYFEAMGIPLVDGRDFSPLEDTTSPLEVIVNEEFARRFLSSNPAPGQIVVSGEERLRVVGVSGDSVYRSFSEPVMPFVYYSYRDRMRRAGQIHVRTRPGTESLLAPRVEQVVRGLDPTLPLFDVRTMIEHVETNQFLRRIPAQMFVVLGPLLLLLAAIGIYSVVAYSVSGRRSDIAVRLALGAKPDSLTRGIVAECFSAVGVGMAVGWMVVVVIYDHLSGGTYEPAVFVGVPATMAAVSIAAAWIPARKAMRVELPRLLNDD